MNMEELRVNQSSCLVGKTLANSGIKQQTGAMVMAIIRENQVIGNPDAEEEILQGDLLIVFGLREQLRRLEDVAANIIKLKYENI